MKMSELRKQIENVPDDIEIFLRCCVNPCGNIVELKAANKDTHGFFGRSIDCIIMEPDIDDQFIAGKR